MRISKKLTLTYYITIFVVMEMKVIRRGVTYYITGLGLVRFIKDESKGKCMVIFQGAKISVDRYELKSKAA